MAPKASVLPVRPLRSDASAPARAGSYPFLAAATSRSAADPKPEGQAASEPAMPSHGARVRLRLSLGDACSGPSLIRTDDLLLGKELP